MKAILVFSCLPEWMDYILVSGSRRKWTVFVYIAVKQEVEKEMKEQEKYLTEFHRCAALVELGQGQ